MLWDGRRAPFTLIGGYLGAGKTTVLNDLIHHAGGRRWAVLVNDVGSVNVDASLIASHDGDTLALTNGCVCCSLGDDLGMTLESVRDWDEPPDRVIMELSGVAEPARVAPWANTAGFRLDGVVVVVDADQVIAQLGRGDIGDTVEAQVRAADLVVLTKTDLAADGGAAARSALVELTRAPIIEADHGTVDADAVLGADHDGSQLSVAAPSGRRSHHRTDVVDVGEVSVAELEALVKALDVIRAKGVVMCVDHPHPHEVHVVGPRHTIRARPDLDRPDANRIVTIHFQVVSDTT